VRSVTVLASLFDGIRLGPNSLLKDCVVQGNEANGVSMIRGESQVEGCVIGGTQAGDGNLGLGS
jgi:hypothetical protein